MSYSKIRPLPIPIAIVDPLRPLSPFGYFLQKEKEIGKGVLERDFAECNVENYTTLFTSTYLGASHQLPSTN